MSNPHKQIEKRDIFIEIVKAVDSRDSGSSGKEKKYITLMEEIVHTNSYYNTFCTLLY